MNDLYQPHLAPLSKNPLIEAASEVAEDIYALIADFPESEKWDTAARLHQGANYLLNNLSRAVSNSAPTGSEFDWGAARKEAGAVLTMLRFAIKQGFLEKNSNLQLKINGLIKDIDAETKGAYKRREAYEQYELSLWQEKYDMWQKLNSEIKK